MVAFTNVAFIVDDLEDNRFMVRQLLRSMGFEEILEAANGFEALAILRKEDLKPIALMVLDLSMPILDGYAVLAEKQNWAHHPKVLVSSAYAFLPEAKKEQLRRADKVLGKPLDVPQFFKSVKELVG